MKKDCDSKDVTYFLPAFLTRSPVSRVLNYGKPMVIFRLILFISHGQKGFVTTS